MIRVKPLVLAGLLALGGALAAEEGKQPPMHGGGHGGPALGGPMQMLKQLGLSKEQKAKLKDLRKARRDRNQALGNKLEDARGQLEELLETADRSKAHEDRLRAKNAEILQLQQEKQKDHFESLLEIRSVLTDEQLKKFIELHEKRHEMREQRKESRKGARKGKAPAKGGEEGDRF